MTYSIEQQPNRLMAANSPMVYVVKESTGAITGADKFRYIVQIQISTTNASALSTRATLKIHKNKAGVGIVDIHKIVRTYLETQETNINVATIVPIHTLGIHVPLKPFSTTAAQAVLVRISGGYEKSTSPSTAPEQFLTPSGTYLSNASIAIPATTVYTRMADDVGGLDDSAGEFPLKYFINDATEDEKYSFLTNAPNIQFVRGGNASGDNIDQATICFKQGNSASSSIIPVGEKLENIVVRYFDSSGSLMSYGGYNTHYFPNSNANGGATAAESDTALESILYFGCGTYNLEAQSLLTNARPSNFTDWAYYIVFGIYGASFLNRCTKYYYFYRYGSGATVDDRHQSCSRYDNIRLAWRNRLGAWDYMNFRGKSTESVDINRTSMAKVPGTWDGSTFSYNSWDRGKKDLYTEATRKLTINSDWLNPDEGAWLEELFTSTNVQILGDGSTREVYPVVITDKSYTKKTSVNNKIKIQYTINLEYANKVRTNS